MLFRSGLAWARNAANLINSSGVAYAGNRYALENNLQQANTEFMQAGTMSWSRFVRSDDTELKRIFGALSNAVLLLQESRGMIRDPAVHALIDEMLQYPPRYKALVDGLTKATQSQADLLLMRAEPQRAKASDMLELMAIRADQRARDLVALTVGETGRAAWVNLILDRKSTRLNSSHMSESRMPSSA